MESVLVDDKPAFIVKNLKTGKISVKETIDLDYCIYRPLGEKECGYIPYLFKKGEIENPFD